MTESDFFYWKLVDENASPKCWAVVKVTVRYIKRWYVIEGQYNEDGSPAITLVKIPQWRWEELVGPTWCEGQGYLDDHDEYVHSTPNPPIPGVSYGPHGPVIPEKTPADYGFDPAHGGICHGETILVPKLPEDHPGGGASPPPGVPTDAEPVDGGTSVGGAQAEAIFNGPCYTKVAVAATNIPPGLQDGDAVVIYSERRGIEHSARWVDPPGCFRSKDLHKAVLPCTDEDGAFDNYKDRPWYYIIYRYTGC